MSLLVVSGLPVVGEIKEPGFLEGGDFFPMGQDLAMLGIGVSHVHNCMSTVLCCMVMNS